MNTKGIIYLQKHIRICLDFRYKHSLFITIINLSKHLTKIKHNLTKLFEIKDIYIGILNKIINKEEYNKIWQMLELLRKDNGGYYSLIFLPYTKIKLFDKISNWEQFLHSCFIVTKLKECKENYPRPVFYLSQQIELSSDCNNILPNISLKWKSYILYGYFIDDPLKFISFSPLTIKNNMINIQNLNDIKTKLYRTCLIPYFLRSDKKTYNSLINFLDKITNLYDVFLKKAISSIASDFMELDEHEKYCLLYLFSIGDEKNIFVSILLYTILIKESPNIANVLLQKLPFETQQIINERTNIADEKLNNINQESNEKYYEIRICALNCSDNVKKIAIEKLREIQSKPADITKPQLFLDKLLEIPFGIIRIESQFKILKLFLKQIQFFVRTFNSNPQVLYPHTWTELRNFFTIHNELSVLNATSSNLITKVIKTLKIMLNLKFLKYTNELGHNYKVLVTKKNNSEITTNFQKFVQYSNPETKQIVSNIVSDLLDSSEYIKYKKQWNDVQKVIEDTQSHVKKTLENAIYGQTSAKRAIEQIICEWITGHSKRGYCFGFEGPPGVGKTSLAKQGLSKCLIDEEGKQRPFFLIALGGSTHGASLEGYGYTYASSTCGKIINTIIQAKCLNPIIFFDELDKISNTPQGQEIIGILVHLTDPTQNTEFVDKYFDGIHIDLSHVLFIFSYNDPSKVDPILLDRIHRIRFESFGTSDKIKICKNYIIPDLYYTLGLVETTINIPNSILETIIETYTREAGVRKLKQILSTMLREINIRVLRNEIETPIIINNELITKDILLDYKPIKSTKIISTPTEGTAAGLFAITSGGGGILHIEIKHCHNQNSQNGGKLELTGNLGKIMQESIRVSHTTIWNIINIDKLKALNININSDSNLHLHCAETSTPKDGPSAGVAICAAMISCILKIPVKNNIAFTGEIDLNGNVHAVGGIKDKLRGAYIAGITLVFCPFDNLHDVEKIDSITDVWIKYLDIKFIKTILDINFLKSSFTSDVTLYMHNNVSNFIRSSISAPQLQLLGK